MCAHNVEGDEPDTVAFLRVGDDELRRAYWYASRLSSHGWVIGGIGADEHGGFFTARTPDQHVVSVGTAAAETAASDDLSARLAAAITALAERSACDGHDYIRDLRMLLGAHNPPQRVADRRWQIWHIPGIAAQRQPEARVRAAYWFAAILVDDYGWRLCEVGTPTARGGFLADIPAETMAVYPAGMPDDGTTASALARLLGGMAPAEVARLAALIASHTEAVVGRRLTEGGQP